MLDRLKALFSKTEEAIEEAESVVRLDATLKWLRGQLKDNIKNHTSMMQTLLGEATQRTDRLRAAMESLGEAQIRTDDFPDAPRLVKNYKDATVNQCLRILDEIDKVIAQETDNIDDYFEKYELLKQSLDEIDKALAHHAKTLRTYFIDEMYEVRSSIAELHKDVENVNDILTSPLLQRIGDIREHVHVSLEKREKREQLQKEMDYLQGQIDEKYREYLRYEGKIKDIKTSSRYKLEKNVPRGRKPNAVGHFSVMEHEIKELKMRSKQIDDRIQDLRVKKKKLHQAYDKLSPDPHIDRLQDLLEQVASVKVTIVHE